jgi:hypothetical protein
VSRGMWSQLSGKSGPRTRLLLLLRRRLRVPALFSGAAAAASWSPRATLESTKDANLSELRRAAAAASTAMAAPPMSVDAPAARVGQVELNNVQTFGPRGPNQVIFFCHTQRICSFLINIHHLKRKKASQIIEKEKRVEKSP